MLSLAPTLGLSSGALPIVLVCLIPAALFCAYVIWDDRRSKH